MKNIGRNNNVGRNLADILRSAAQKESEENRFPAADALCGGGISDLLCVFLGAAGDLAQDLKGSGGGAAGAARTVRTDIGGTSLSAVVQ